MLLKLVLFVCIVTLIGFAAFSITTHEESNMFTKTSSSFSTSQEAVDPSLSADISFWGNTFWGRYIHDWSQASELGVKYPFSGLEDFNKQTNEYWVSGLECPTADVNPTSAEQESILKFNCRPEYIPEAAKYINAFTLANNHTDNYEEVQGFEQTKLALADNKVEFFGSFDNRPGEICKLINVPFYNKKERKTEVPIAFCGYHWVFGLPTNKQLDEIDKYSKDYLTIVMPHGGAEYTATPDQLKTALYQEMIDRGADMVIGDHPHVVQTTEVYKDKLIVYSLGNFLFDQQYSFEVTRSMSARAILRLPEGYAVSKKPAYTAAYSLRCTDNSKKKLKKATEADCQKLVDKSKWQFGVEI